MLTGIAVSRAGRRRRADEVSVLYEDPDGFGASVTGFRTDLKNRIERDLRRNLHVRARRLARELAFRTSLQVS